GRPAKIIIKINGLTDSALIQDLYRASQAGVTIHLIVRGICCLRPGVPGVSERITVRSIVGRFLEHSRVFWFANRGPPGAVSGPQEAFVGSADLMERNLDRRVEVLCPVLDPALRGYLRDVVLDLYLGDTDRSWVLDSSGTYAPPSASTAPVNAQQALLTRHTVD